MLVMKISEFAIKEKGSIDIDWNEVEKHINFKLHDNVKDYFSRAFSNNSIIGSVKFTEKDFIKPTGNKRNDTWFSFNRCEGKVEFELEILKKAENAAFEIENAFNIWTGGNDFGHRAMIGQFYFNIGQILILINNDTGKVEWLDCGYGYFDIYDENPNGILADDIQEFLNKLVK